MFTYRNNLLTEFEGKQYEEEFYRLENLLSKYRMDRNNIKNQLEIWRAERELEEKKLKKESSTRKYQFEPLPSSSLLESPQKNVRDSVERKKFFDNYEKAHVEYIKSKNFDEPSEPQPKPSPVKGYRRKSKNYHSTNEPEIPKSENILTESLTQARGRTNTPKFFNDSLNQETPKKVYLASLNPESSKFRRYKKNSNSNSKEVSPTFRSNIFATEPDAYNSAYDRTDMTSMASPYKTPSKKINYSNEKTTQMSASNLISPPKGNYSQNYVDDYTSSRRINNKHAMGTIQSIDSKKSFNAIPPEKINPNLMTPVMNNFAKSPGFSPSTQNKFKKTQFPSDNYQYIKKRLGQISRNILLDSEHKERMPNRDIFPNESLKTRYLASINQDRKDRLRQILAEDANGSLEDMS